MRPRTKLLLVAGARPNFMKIAPVIKAIQRHQRNSSVEYKLVHTGQHYGKEMSHIFFTELGIPSPDINLDVGSSSHAMQTANVMVRFETVCEREWPDWIVVVGDVNSTLGCALVGAKMGIKVAHVEAGLRSFDRSMPEEINRIVTDSISDLLLTPSEDGNENLQREGVDEGKVKLVGNVMIDALLENLELARKCAVESCLGIEKQGFAYVTLHRPSNVDTAESLIPLMSELRGLSERIPVVFPMHPRTRARCAQFGISISGSTGLKLMEPVGYNESLWLTENARLVLTDSGGLQEESTYFRTPCLTLRPNTERPITIRMGSNKLTSLESLSKDIGDVFEREPRFGTIPPLWDGCAAERIVNALMAGSR